MKYIQTKLYETRRIQIPKTIISHNSISLIEKTTRITHHLFHTKITFSKTNNSLREQNNETPVQRIGCPGRVALLRYKASFCIKNQKKSELIPDFRPGDSIRHYESKTNFVRNRIRNLRNGISTLLFTRE